MSLTTKILTRLVSEITSKQLIFSLQFLPSQSKSKQTKWLRFYNQLTKSLSPSRKSLSSHQINLGWIHTPDFSWERKTEIITSTKRSALNIWTVKTFMESHKRPSPVSKKRKIKPSENQNIQRLNPKRQICTVNSTLQNHKISAKKKFSILTKLMKSQKLSSIPPIISKNEVINDAQRKSDIFNDLFTAKATVEGNDDPVSVLEPLDNILESLDQINTSPIEISKIFRQLKSVTLRTVVFLVNSSI